MAFEEIATNLSRLNDSIRSFTKSSAAYYKLDLFYKAMKGTTAAVKTVAIVFFGVFGLLFLSIAVALGLSDWLDSESSGFFIVGIAYVLGGLIILYFGSPLINRLVLSRASKGFFNDTDDKPRRSKKEHVVGREFDREESKRKDHENI